MPFTIQDPDTRLQQLISDLDKRLSAIERTRASMASTSSLTLIDDLVVSGSALASYDTNTRLGGNIPQTYKDLILVMTGRCNAASQAVPLNLRFNNNSGANYDYQMATVQGAALGTTANGNSQAQAIIGRIAGSTADTSRIGSATIEVPNYTGTSFFQDARSVIGNSYASASAVETGTSYVTWHGLSAITQITLYPASGSFVVGSRFSLYGRG